MSTATTIPPGSTVSVPIAARTAVRVTVLGAPGAAVPDVCERVSAPPSEDVIDQDTGPPVAVRMRGVESPAWIVILVWLTLSVRGGGGVVVLVFGAGELGLGLVLVGLGEAL